MLPSVARSPVRWLRTYAAVMLTKGGDRQASRAMWNNLRQTADNDWVRSSATNGYVEVEVTDTGMGISRENLNRIFDPFFTTKATGRGTGLGLSVSYGIIKEHAGKIEVRSTPNKGTSFRLEFPAARKAVHA